MSKPNDGGPAFPCKQFDDSSPKSEDWNEYDHPGMTLRDYFAAEIMSHVEWFGLEDIEEFHERARKEAAEMCYKIADAMLRARKK